MKTRSLLSCALALAMVLPACAKKEKDTSDQGGKDKEGMGEMAPPGTPVEKEMGPDAMKPDEPDKDAMKPDEPKLEAVAKSDKETPEGVITEAKGTVEVRRRGTEDFKAAEKEEKVFAGDAVRVGKEGGATVALWDNSSLDLTPETAVAFAASDAIKDPAPAVTVLSGAVRLDVNPRTEGQGPLVVYTPSSVVSVQGTSLVIGVALSGAMRVAVETGKVDVTAVAKTDGPPVVVEAGKVVVVPRGKVPEPAVAYNADQGGWDAWMDAEEKAAAEKAEDTAKEAVDAVDEAKEDADKLDAADDKTAGEADKLQAQATDAEKANDPKAYQTVQPQIEDNLEAQDLVFNQRRLVEARMMANAYLLYAMHRRLQAAGGDVPPEVMAAIRSHHDRSSRAAAMRWQLAEKRRAAYVNRLDKVRKVYYYHTPTGRQMAPKLKVQLPKFYAKVVVKPRARRAPVAIVGWTRPVIARPVYRGVRVAPAPGVIVHKRPKDWYAKPGWKKHQEVHVAKVKVNRVRFQKTVVAHRVKFIKEPPRKLVIVRGRHGGMGPDRDGMHGMGPDRDGRHDRDGMHEMGPDRDGMLGMGPDRDGMHGMGPDRDGRREMGLDRDGRRDRDAMRGRDEGLKRRRDM
jgi:hypothetical protein